MITLKSKKKRFHRCREWPCYRAKSRELLNSRLRFYFRIDKEKMEADLNLFSFSPWTIERKERKRERRIFLSLSRSHSFLFLLSSSSQWRTFRNCADIHSLNFFRISDWALKTYNRRISPWNPRFQKYSF